MSMHVYVFSSAHVHVLLVCIPVYCLHVIINHSSTAQAAHAFKLTCVCLVEAMITLRLYTVGFRTA